VGKAVVEARVWGRSERAVKRSGDERMVKVGVEWMAVMQRETLCLRQR
jgi:hypothetical protein